MDTTTAELRYLDILESLSPEQLDRLPAAIRENRYDFPRLISELPADFLAMVNPEGISSMVRELQRMLEAATTLYLRSEAAKSNLRRLLPGKKGRGLRAEAERRSQEFSAIELEAAVLYSRILAEYSFVSISFDLEELIRTQKILSTSAIGIDEEQLEEFASTIRKNIAAIRRSLTIQMRTVDSIYSAIELQMVPEPIEAQPVR